MSVVGWKHGAAYILFIQQQLAGTILLVDSGILSNIIKPRNNNIVAR